MTPMADQQPLFLESGNNPFDPNSPYEIDGIPVSQEEFNRRMDNGSVGGDVYRHGLYQTHVGFTSHGLGMFSASWSTYTPGYWSDTSVRVLDQEDQGQTTGGGPAWTPGYTTNYTWNASFSSPRQRGQSHSPSTVSLPPRDLPDCPPYPAYPGHANLDANIRAMRASYLSIVGNSPFDTGSAFARGSAHIASFVARVRPGGEWDYKRLSTPQISYERFGNFHFGAVGGAAEFTLGQLLRAAGVVQQWAGDSDGDGGSASITNALKGEGGQAPFGDQIRDQEQIKEGYSYYIRKFVLKLCK